MKYLTVLLFFSFMISYSQYSSKIIEYDENISFQIMRLRGSDKGGFGIIPLRGFTSFTLYLKFTNNSDKISEANLEDIHLANPKTGKKYPVKWFNVAGPGSKMDPSFKLSPGKSKKFILYYIFENKQRLYFLINDKLTAVKSQNEN